MNLCAPQQRKIHPLVFQQGWSVPRLGGCYSGDSVPFFQAQEGVDQIDLLRLLTFKDRKTEMNQSHKKYLKVYSQETVIVAHHTNDGDVRDLEHV